MNKKLAILSSIALLALPFAALAAATDPADWVIGVIQRVINIILWPLFIGLIVIMSIWAGILYLTARGEPGKIQTANKMMIFILIGIAVVILGYGAYETIKQLIPTA